MKRDLPARLLLALLLTTFATVAPAQEAADEGSEPPIETADDLEPAVDTSAPAVSPNADVVRQREGSQVMDRIELERTQITGNQELPKVLSIVPWQKSDPDDLPGPPVGSLLDEVPEPLNREEFTRQVEFYDEFYGNEE